LINCTLVCYSIPSLNSLLILQIHLYKVTKEEDLKAFLKRNIEFVSSGTVLFQKKDYLMSYKFMFIVSSFFLDTV
jgi:hypothetical protein